MHDGPCRIELWQCDPVKFKRGPIVDFDKQIKEGEGEFFIGEAIRPTLLFRWPYAITYVIDNETVCWKEGAIHQELCIGYLEFHSRAVEWLARARGDERRIIASLPGADSVLESTLEILTIARIKRLNFSFYLVLINFSM